MEKGEFPKYLTVVISLLLLK